MAQAEAASLPVFHTVPPEFRVGPLKLLEARGLLVQMCAEHAENAAGARVAHVIDFAVWHPEAPDIGPDVRLGPERERR